jgi:hypothetical protein
MATGPRRQLVSVPEGVANALRPESRRDRIPTRTELGPDAVPFAGELYEQVNTSSPGVTVPAGATVVLCTLRRVWPLVGFAVNPGNGAGTLTASLRVHVRGMLANVAGSPLAIPAGAPLASLALFIGARAELIVVNSGGAPSLNVQGTLYGMKE